MEKEFLKLLKSSAMEAILTIRLRNSTVRRIQPDLSLEELPEEMWFPLAVLLHAYTEEQISEGGLKVEIGGHYSYLPYLESLSDEEKQLVSFLLGSIPHEKIQMQKAVNGFRTHL